MICLRCGYCCTYTCVTIVDDPEKDLSQDNIVFRTGTEGKCKHLKGSGIGNYRCAVHHKEWYEETPCYDHTQIERRNTNCRTGEHFLKLFKDKDIERVYKENKK